MTKKPRTTPPEEDANVLWLSAKRHPKRTGSLPPDRRKKAWAEETAEDWDRRVAQPKGGVKGGAAPSD